MKIGYLSALVSPLADTTVTPASRNPRDCSVRMSLARRFWSALAELARRGRKENGRWSRGRSPSALGTPPGKQMARILARTVGLPVRGNLLKRSP